MVSSVVLGLLDLSTYTHTHRWVNRVSLTARLFLKPCLDAKRPAETHVAFFTPLLLFNFTIYFLKK